MAQKRYTEEQRQIFVTRAAEIGPLPAMRELGYPSARPTATHWCQNAGVRITLSELQRHASEIKQFYGVQEKLTVCQRLLDECYDILERGERDPETETLVERGGEVFVEHERKPLTSSVLSRLSVTVTRTIATMELLEGRASSRIEVATDATDLELSQMIREYRSRNAVSIQELQS